MQNRTLHFMCCKTVVGLYEFQSQKYLELFTFIFQRRPIKVNNSN